MSGFEYYEFQTVDLPLSIQEMETVQQLSSRARVNSTRARFLYNFGSFRGKPEEIIGMYFDAMLYVSNFGTKKLCFKLRRALIDLPAIQAYETKGLVDVLTYDQFVLVCMSLNDDEGGGGWMEEEDVESLLSELLPIRRAIMLGDYRALFLACMANLDEQDPHFRSLPVPSNLQNLNSALIVFAKFFELNQSDIDAQAARCVAVDDAVLPVSAIGQLSQSEMSRFLEGFLHQEPCVDVEFIQALRAMVLAKQ